MAKFQWRGSDVRGREQRGECAAPGLIEAAAQVRALGVSPTVVDRIDTEVAARVEGTPDAFTTFNRNLAEMTQLGLPLARAVREISSGLRGGRFKQALLQVEAGLREGRPLDEAVAKVSGPFPSYYRWMLKAGTASGNLPAVLSAVARNTEGIRIARRALFEALAYPAVVLLFAAAITASFGFFFMPIYRDVCRQYYFEPPLTVTVFLRLFGSVEVLAAAGAGLIAIGAGVWTILRRTVAGERFLRRIPLLGRIRTHLSTARLLGALGVLLRTNTPLPSALPVAIGAAGSLELEREGERLGALASEGRGLGEILSQAPGVAPEVAGYLALAERLGNAPLATGEVARLLTEQAAAESESLFVLLMPAALLAAGALIATLMASIILPYFHFVEELHP